MKKIIRLESVRRLGVGECSDRLKMILSFPAYVPRHGEHSSDGSALSDLRTTATTEDRSRCTNSLNMQREVVGSGIVPLVCWRHNFRNFQACQQQCRIQLDGQHVPQDKQSFISEIPSISSSIKHLIGKTGRKKWNMSTGCIPPVSNPATGSG